LTLTFDLESQTDGSAQLVCVL